MDHPKRKRTVGAIKRRALSDQYQLDAILATQGFYPISLGSKYSYQAIERLASVPSPLSNVKKLPDPWPNSMNASVQPFFNVVQQNRESLRKELNSTGKPSCMGYNPRFICAPDDLTVETWVPSWRPSHSLSHHRANVALGRSILLAESQSSRKHKLFIQRCVDPRPEQKPRTEQLEYFLVNQGLPNVSLHGHPLDLYTVAGPLPPFSVIEAGTKVIFWWRDELALTYDPSKAGKKDTRKRKQGDETGDMTNCGNKIAKRLKDTGKRVGKRFEEEEGNRNHNADDSVGEDNDSEVIVEQSDDESIRDYTSGTDEGAPYQMSSEQRWQRAFRQGRRRSKMFKPENSGNRQAHSIPKRELTDEDVVLGIAAVWRGLRKVDIDWAFGNAAMFSICRHQRTPRCWSVDNDRDFIIPVLVGGDEEIERSQPPQELFSEYQRDFVDLQPGVELAEEKADSRKAAERTNAEERKKEVKRRVIATKNVRAKRKSAKDKGETRQEVDETTLVDEEVERLKHEESETNQLQEFQGGMGHLTLAVAHHPAQKRSPGHLEIYYFDSLGGRGGSNRTAAQNIIQNSGFLGDLVPDVGPNDEKNRPVAQQSCGNTCGIHAILNAWFIMFHLQRWRLNPDFKPRMRFYRQAHRIIQSALNGKADFIYILAFFQTTGYCQPRDFHEWQRQVEQRSSEETNGRLNEPSMNRLYRGRSRLTNTKILDFTVHRMRRRTCWIPRQAQSEGEEKDDSDVDDNDVDESDMGVLPNTNNGDADETIIGEQDEITPEEQLEDSLAHHLQSDPTDTTGGDAQEAELEGGEADATPEAGGREGGSRAETPQQEPQAGLQQQEGDLGGEVLQNEHRAEDDDGAGRGWFRGCVAS